MARSLGPGAEETPVKNAVRVSMVLLCVLALYYLVVTLARSVATQ